MANLNEINRISKLNPFGRFCCTIGNLPASYMESLSYEHQLVWFCNFLEKKVIPAVNNNAEVVEEIQELFIELKSYVDNYFENLDVQNEINEKLDAMVLDGTLDEIINHNIFNELYSFKKTHQIGGTILPSYVGDFMSNYQFGCVARKNDVIYCVSPHNYDNFGDIHAFEIASNSLLWKKTNVHVGHGNSIAFDDSRDCFWIAPLSVYDNGVAAAVDYIYKYDSSFSDVTIVEMPERIYAVSYDSSTNILYAMSIIDNNDIKIYKMASDENEFTLFTSIPRSELTYLGDSSVFQDMAVDDGVIYIVKPEGTMYIALLEENTTHISNTSRVDRNDSGNVWIYGELEGIEFDDNHRLYSANCSYLNVTNTGEHHSVTNAFVTELNYKGNAFPSSHTAQTIHGTLTLSEATQNKFKLGNAEIRSLNQLAYLKEPFGTVSVPQNNSVNEFSRVRISQRTSAFTLSIEGTYTCDIINIDAGMFQLYIASTGKFISNSPTQAINVSNRTTILMLRNKGEISMPNSESQQFVFSGYAPTICAIMEMNNPNEMIFGDATVSSPGMLMGNVRIYGTLPPENP